jgi:IclR family transcriptional regulator, acetate operon repressor
MVQQSEESAITSVQGGGRARNPRATRSRRVDHVGRLPSNDRAHLQSLQRAIAVMGVIASNAQQLTATEIVAEIGLERTIVHRILKTLEYEGLIARRGGRYTMAARALAFGNAYLEHLPLRKVAMPFQQYLLYDLFRGQPWAVSLFVSTGREIVVVNQMFNPDAPFDMIMGLGTRFEMVDSAAGRCMLAYTPPAVVAGMLGAKAARQLEPRLAKIREVTNGVDTHERSGIFAISCALRDRSGAPVGALTMSGLEILEQYEEVSASLRRASSAIVAGLP